MKRMEMLFISELIEKDKEASITGKARHKFDVANHVQCWNFIDGIEHNINRPISLLSDISLPLWPLYPKLIFRGYEWSHRENAEDAYVGYINFTSLLSKLSKFITMYRGVKGWVKKHEGEQVIIIFSIYTPYLLSAVLSAERRTKICLIVPDLPEYMDEYLDKKPIKKLLKKLDRHLINKMLKRVDYFVLFADAMAESLNVGNRPTIRIEALSPIEEAGDINNIEKTDGSLLYTGTLDKRYGITDLLEAFALVKNRKARLWICGAGNAQDDIERAAQNDPRIRWFGHVSREEVLRLQKEANILINPRSGQGEYTKYSFPSKTIEYMLSGTPVIMRRLDGIPREYYNHIIVDEIATVESLAQLIEDTLKLSREQTVEMGRRARDFILKEKNPAAQCKKILELMDIDFEQKQK